ncbi:MAG: VWA domain-containing protein [Verrucomicrobiota bacterium]
MAAVEYSEEQLKRWRLVLGRSAHESLESLSGDEGMALDQDERAMDEALAAIYEDEGGGGKGSGRGAGHEMSSPQLNRWLGDIRTYFQEDVVAVIQQDAIERKGLDQLLFEPETLKNVQPNLSLVGTLLTLSSRIPEKTKDTAREVVGKVVAELKKHLENDIRQAVLGALNRRAHSPIPRADAIDWKATIGRNLKHYQPSIEALVPERVFFFSRSRQVNAWKVIVALDQSGSMAESVVYGAVTGSIFASLPALDTRVVAFDTEVVDLTEDCGDDPVDMLMGVQLGGGTDINKAVAYCQEHISDPAKTLFVLITDLMEGGVEAQLIRRMKEIKESGVRTFCLLALSDSGIPWYDERVASKLANLGVPCFGCTPEKLPELVHGALAGDDLVELAKRVRTKSKKAGSHL